MINEPNDLNKSGKVLYYIGALRVKRKEDDYGKFEDVRIRLLHPAGFIIIACIYLYVLFTYGLKNEELLELKDDIICLY